MGTMHMAPRRGRPKGSGIVWPSAKTVYTLRACTALAAVYPERLLKADEIATASKAPVRFLSKILGELRVAGLVSARRGHHGGYALLRDPAEILVRDVIVAVGSEEILVPLPPQLEHPPSVFVDDLRRKLIQVALDAFDGTTVADLAREYQLHDPTEASPAPIVGAPPTGIAL